MVRLIIGLPCLQLIMRLSGDGLFLDDALPAIGCSNDTLFRYSSTSNFNDQNLESIFHILHAYLNLQRALTEYFANFGDVC